MGKITTTKQDNKSSNRANDNGEVGRDGEYFEG